MNPQHTKLTVAALWMLSICTIAVVVDTTSVTGWIAVAAAGLVPPGVMLGLSRPHPVTTSERIREAIR